MEVIRKMTDLLYQSAVPFMLRKGIHFYDLGGAVTFTVQVSDKKDLSILIIDMSERMKDGEGLKILVPDIIAFPANVDAASAANDLNSRENVIGEFTVAQDRTLRFALETVFSEDGGDGPDQVEAALDIAMDSVMGVLLPKASNGAGGDWDIGDIILNGDDA